MRILVFTSILKFQVYAGWHKQWRSNLLHDLSNKIYVLLNSYIVMRSMVVRTNYIQVSIVNPSYLASR